MKIKKLSLVGAGPGDAELITLKALRVIGEADVLLYDSLANESFLKYAKPACIIKYVGKRCGQHSLTQNKINNLIVEMAEQHGHVVRLKGGDCFVFGRAEEEIMAASKAGICIEVIPGISSALAVPASISIPMTSRGRSESFWVITGTTKSGAISKDIEMAAKSSATVVLLMAMTKIKTIMEIFIRNGKQNLPVAIIQNGTTANEQFVVGCVGDIVQKALDNHLGHPAVIILGEVVRLHNNFSELSAIAAGNALG